MATQDFSGIVDPFADINDPFVKQPGEEQSEIQEPVPTSPEEQQASSFEGSKESLVGRMFPEESRGGTAATVGGMIGGALGTPAGPAGILAGGALGAGIGRTIYGAATGEGFVDQLKGFTEAARSDAMWSGAFMTAMPALKALGPVFNKVAGLLGDNRNAKELATIANQLNIPVGLVSISDKKIVKGIPKITGIFPMVGSPARRSVQETYESISKKKDQFLEMVGPNVSLQQVGIDMTAAAKNASKEFSDTADTMYKNFFRISEDLGSPAVIPTDDLKAAVAGLKAKSVRPRTIDPVTGKPGELAKPRPTGFQERFEEYANDLLKLADTISPEEFRAIQLDLNNLARQPDSEKHLVGPVKKALESSFSPGSLKLTGISPKDALALREALDTANNFYSLGMTKFSSPQAKVMGRVDKNLFESGHFQAGNVTPDKIAEISLRARSPQGIQNLRELVGPSNIRNLAAEFMNRASSQSTKHLKDQGETFSFSAFEKHLGLNTEDGVRTMREFLKDTPLKVEELQSLVKLGKRVDEIHIPDTASMIQRRMVLGGASSGASLVMGGLQGFGTHLGAMFLARQGNKLISKPETVRWLMGTLDDKKGAPFRRAMAAKLMNELAREEGSTRTYEDALREREFSESLRGLQ